MTTITVTHEVQAAIRALLDRAVDVASAYGSEIETEVRQAANTPLDQASAERLYTRVLSILSNLDAGELSDDERRKALETIRREAAELAADGPRPDPQPPKVVLIERHGLPVRDVVPTPQFNGVPVPMKEGYVDVLTLEPWSENQRVVLHVADFESRFDRQPDRDDLMGILQGTVTLQAGESDPFKLRPLASSIARKGVERPPIITADGIPHDGNRRIAASRFVVESGEFSAEDVERARWVRVWQTAPGTTDDQLDAMVLALNFEEDYKEPWPEYVKAKLVAEEFRSRLEVEKRLPSATRERTIRGEVAKKFAINARDVTRYLRMVQWADDFTDYHLENGRPESEISYRTNHIFQWFYELEAGKTGEKVTEKFESDPELRAMVYDLMFDSTFESGAQVRAMYQVVNDDESYRQLIEAHGMRETQQKEAKQLVVDAINDARARRRAASGMSLDQYALGIIKRLGGTPANSWSTLETELLKELRGTLIASLGALDGVLSIRGAGQQGDEA